MEKQVIGTSLQQLESVYQAQGMLADPQLCQVLHQEVGIPSQRGPNQTDTWVCKYGDHLHGKRRGGSRNNCTKGTKGGAEGGHSRSSGTRYGGYSTQSHQSEQ